MVNCVPIVPLSMIDVEVYIQHIGACMGYIDAPVYYSYTYIVNEARASLLLSFCVHKQPTTNQPDRHNDRQRNHSITCCAYVHGVKMFHSYIYAAMYLSIL